MPREPLVRGALEDAAIQQTDQLLDGVWRGGGGTVYGCVHVPLP